MWEKKAQRTGGKLSGEVQVSRDILRRRMDKNMIQRVAQHSRGATCMYIRIIYPRLCEFPKLAVCEGQGS